MSESGLKVNVDYYMREDGLMIFTEAFLLRRGHCCQSGCLHCPYGYSSKIDPNFPQELQTDFFTESEDDLD